MPHSSTSKLLASLLCCLLISAAHAQESLELDKTIQRELQGGQAHSFLANLGANHPQGHLGMAPPPSGEVLVDVGEQRKHFERQMQRGLIAIQINEQRGKRCLVRKAPAPLGDCGL